MPQLAIHTHIDAFLAVAECELARDEVTNGLTVSAPARRVQSAPPTACQARWQCG